MPFTPSHALVALPFVRTPLVPAAIAIGAMTPDLPLFVRGVGLNYTFTHTFGNVLWTALLAFVLFLVWRVLLRPAVPELAPLWLARRLPREWSEGGSVAAGRAVGVGEKRSYPVLLAVSLLIGVLSHIVWDLFTHEGRWGVQQIPALDEMWGPLPGFKWLQHGSSLIGLAIIGIWALLWLRRRVPRLDTAQSIPHGVRLAWWVSLPVILVGAWAVGLAVFGPLDAEFTVQHLAYRVLPPACALWGVITVVLCVVLAVRGRRHQRG
ncbi:DUF4184 family protein [Microbacterium sp. KKR3/1]|uniref:DUF4184 family protein n=1 Tax=Microbacterium sp. KKR3/1 TaxID=2904241 RepID=UPI001E54288A|nr:DUF4184 family protein [Microbacterium sp. KKR3/1]MCE0510329.1 DUF4184 family protein [Microbacterium sp. KKR3/1]